MALALSTTQGLNITSQSLTLLIVAFLITFLVYRSVALIVKADDYGIFLVKTSKAPFLRKTLVQIMPYLLNFITFIGTLAMLWVGGSITAHSIDYIGYHGHAGSIIFIFESTGLEGFFIGF